MVKLMNKKIIAILRKIVWMILTCVMAFNYHVAESFTYPDMNSCIRCNPVGEWVQMQASRAAGHIAQHLFH